MIGGVKAVGKTGFGVVPDAQCFNAALEALAYMLAGLANLLEGNINAGIADFAYLDIVKIQGQALAALLINGGQMRPFVQTDLAQAGQGGVKTLAAAETKLRITRIADAQSLIDILDTL